MTSPSSKTAAPSQLTVTRVLRALVNKTIDRQSASTLLYGLQLALQSVDRGRWAIGPFDTVEGLSQTPDGDVIASDPDEDLEDEDEEEEGDEEEQEDEEEGEEEEEEEEEAPSDAASNSHHEDAGDSGDEMTEDDNDEEDEDNDLENESTEQLFADLNQLQSVSRALEAGDMRHAARLLGVGG